MCCPINVIIGAAVEKWEKRCTRPPSPRTDLCTSYVKLIICGLVNSTSKTGTNYNNKLLFLKKTNGNLKYEYIINLNFIPYEHAN